MGPDTYDGSKPLNCGTRCTFAGPYAWSTLKSREAAVNSSPKCGTLSGELKDIWDLLRGIYLA